MRGHLTLALLLPSVATAQLTERVSVSTSGAQSDGTSASELNGIAITPDGRFVAFASAGTTLVVGDTNAASDVFVRDRILGTTDRASVATGGTQANGASDAPSISSDGRYVAFASLASDLAGGDTNGKSDVFVRDRLAGTTDRVSVATGGAQGTGNSTAPSISRDGRYVAFESDAANLVAGDTNGRTDVFVHDRQTGTTTRVSLTSTGGQGNLGSDEAALSADGRYLAFDCWATNFVPGDTNGCEDLFVRDLQLGTLERLSVSAGGAQCNDSTGQSKISGDGRYVVFFSWATNLVPGDTNLVGDIFVRDRVAGTIERASLGNGAVEPNNGSLFASISDDGRFVAFFSEATNLVPGDGNGVGDVFVRDRTTATTVRASVSSGGGDPDGESTIEMISPDGRWIAFSSTATNLVAGDTNGVRDVFVRDLGQPGFTSLCTPGASGVIACPCSNAAAGPDRGCDNSNGTGGAAISAVGTADLSGDTLVFTTSGEMPTATSILLQGDAPIPTGAVFGQGVRCVGGTLKRMYVKTAAGGSITAPDFGAGDPTVSAQSAALGDAIAAGQSRYYAVYYRDPTVQGGCPAGSTFNVTQTGRVDWWP